MEELTEKSFANQKKQTLVSIDYSRKGNIDLPIKELMTYINDQKDLFTTSSCSGRIVLFSEGMQKKKGCVWIYVTHNKADPDQMFSSILECNLQELDVVSLKFEPFVLHCQCRTFCLAEKMLKCALEAGFRNSGLIIGKKKRIMLAVRSTHGMEVPLVFQGQLMISKEYVNRITGMANERLVENFKRIERFYEALRAKFESTDTDDIG